jgi:beta-glucanase (GH16 family)
MFADMSLRAFLTPVLALGIAVGAVACQPTIPTGGTTTTSTPTWTPTTAPPTTTTVPAPRLLGGDEFDGSRLDGSKWKAYSNTYGNSGGGSRHCLSPNNVAVSGGSLKITSKRQAITCSDGTVQPYSSGFIGSREVGRFYPLEGSFTVRAKVPHGQGVWPAFWLRHRNGASVAEVDILESFHAQVPGKASQVLHLDGEINTANRATWFETPTATPGWHTFSVRIDRLDGDRDGAADDVRFDFSIDGKATHGYVDLNPRWVSAADPAATWDVAINTAVDGRWVGNPDGELGRLDQIRRCSLSGTYPACSTTGLRRIDWSAPVVFEIDWLRVEALS